jgi:hypothetical protein
MSSSIKPGVQRSSGVRVVCDEGRAYVYMSGILVRSYPVNEWAKVEKRVRALEAWKRG